MIGLDLSEPRDVCPWSNVPSPTHVLAPSTECLRPWALIRRCGVLAIMLTLAVLPTLALAQEAQEQGPAPLTARDQKVNAAIEKGTNYLLSQQGGGGQITDRPQHETAMTALAIMALSSVGHQPIDDTREGLALRKAIDYVLRDDRVRDGYYGKADGSNMYGHGIVTLMLAEMLGMGVDEKQDTMIRKRLQDGIDVILKSQDRKKGNPSHQGGWRYQPGSNDSDLSVTVWQLMALRAAYNDGLDVPKESIDEAVEYLKRSYKSGRDAQGRPVDMNSGFAYQPGGNPEYATTAAGLLSMQVAGQYDAPEVQGAADWMLRKDLPPKRNNWFYYGTYYYAQGMYQRSGKYAQIAELEVPKVLLPRQEDNGSWSGDDTDRAGRVYSTSLAILSLGVKHHYLPIYQR